MPKARLKFDGKEFYLGSGITTIGRTPDNSISFPDDPNVSRNHAEIIEKGDYYCLVDTGSSNGTTVSGQDVKGELYLWDGASILLGGSAKIDVQFADEHGKFNDQVPVQVQSEEAPDNIPAAESAPEPENTEKPKSGAKKMMFAAGGILGIAVLVAGGAGVMYMGSSSSCNATATIIHPELADIITKPTEVEIEVTDSECVGRASFTIDGIEFASSEDAPFTATIDPKEFPEFSDGYDHGLAVVLEDRDGNVISPSAPVLLAFETKSTSKPDKDTDVAQGGDQQKPGGSNQTSSEVSLIDINNMSKKVVSQFPGSASLNVSNKQFLQEIQKRTAEFAQPGFYDRAARFRDPINVAFVSEQNLDARLGFYLAMSRSKFMPEAQGNDLGLWRMTNDFATANGYTGICGTETITDASQNCAAKAASLYLKQLVLGVFENDVIYSVAAFGKTTQDAGVWKSTLPANRSDIWNSIKTAPEREQVVRFIAAAIVAENPQKFGLGSEKPLTELFRLTL